MTHRLLALIVAVSLSAIAAQATTPSFATRQDFSLYDAHVTVAGYNGNGAAVVAVSPSPIGYNDSVLSVFTYQLGSFQQVSTYDLGYNLQPIAVGAGDLNGDGLTDFVVLGATSLEVLYQQSNGTFLVDQIELGAANSSTFNIVVADINGDGKPDIVVPTAIGTILILNEGGLRLGKPVIVNSAAAQFVAVADFNQDGHADLAIVTSSNCCGQFNLAISLGDGHGGFSEPLTQPALSVTGPEIVTKDLTGDGIPDIAAAANSGVSIAKGNGDGTFAAPTVLPAPSSYGTANAVFATDLNGDGNVDLIALVSGNNESAAAVYYGGAHGLFETPLVYPVQSANYVAAANFTGTVDLVIYEQSPGFYSSAALISLLAEQSSGGFQDGQVYQTTALSYMATGDINNDGRPDLVTLSNSGQLTTFLNTGKNANLFSAQPAQSVSLIGPIATGDFNRDGRLDLVTTGNGSAQVLLGSGNGNFLGGPASASLGGYANAIAVADMNGDHKLDLVTDIPSVLLGNGDGTFQNAIVSSYYCYYGSGPLVVSDFNGDGKPDAVVLCGPEVNLFINSGNGTLNFASQLAYASYQGGGGLVAGDFNGDGIPDIAYTTTVYGPTSTDTGVQILIGTGNGNFINGAIIPVPGASGDLMVARDLNGDGKLDLAVLDTADSAVSILTGNGDGTFQNPVYYGTGTDPTCILANDFRSPQRPGRPDLAFCSGQGISLILNNTK